MTAGPFTGVKVKQILRSITAIAILKSMDFMIAMQAVYRFLRFWLIYYAVKNIPKNKTYDISYAYIDNVKSTNNKNKDGGNKNNNNITDITNAMRWFYLYSECYTIDDLKQWLKKLDYKITGNVIILTRDLSTCEIDLDNETADVTISDITITKKLLFGDISENTMVELMQV
jgi:hypothetical protein